MAAVELYFSIQTPAQAPPAPRAPSASEAAAADAGSVREQVRQTIRDVREASQQAAKDAAKDAAREGKTVSIAKDGTVTIDGQTIYSPGAPGMLAPAVFDNSNLIPPQAVDIAMGFFIMVAVMVVGWPISRAFGRRLERRGTEPAAIPHVITEQLQRIEQAVDAMSIEVERISESQRFMAKLQQQSGADQMALPRERG